MHFQWFINLSLLLAVFGSCLAQQTADTLANSKTKQILAYIAGLPQQGKSLSGQFSGYSPDTFSTTIIDQISQQIGQTPAILGCDWACGWNYKTPPENIIDYSCNPSLKAHWSLGGLVTVNMHLPNPVSPNGGGYKDKMNLNFADMIDTGTATGQRWRLFLDRIALGLDDLQQSGVTVLFRPFHEMNGEWFFWGNQDPQRFKNVWIDMFNYLTITKNLHNILWVYSPDQSRGNRITYYPGSPYVDITALDVYVDDPNTMNGYNEMISLNKVFALGEVGPSTVNGQFAYTRWLTAIDTNYTKTAYFLAWNENWAPISNQYPCAFYNNHRVINRDGTALSNSLITTTTTTLAPTTTTTVTTTTTTTVTTTTTTTTAPRTTTTVTTTTTTTVTTTTTTTTAPRNTTTIAPTTTTTVTLTTTTTTAPRNTTTVTTTTTTTTAPRNTTTIAPTTTTTVTLTTATTTAPRNTTMVTTTTTTTTAPRNTTTIAPTTTTTTAPRTTTTVITTTSAASSSSSSSSPSVVIYNFSNGVGQWQGNNLNGGPWESNEFTFASTDSLKADVQLYAGSSYYIYTDQVSTFTFSNYQKLFAQARVASWGFQSGGTMSAKLYIKTGSSWTWYDSGAVQLNSNAATQLVFNLNSIPLSALADIKEVGVQYISSSDGSQTSVYVAYITASN